MGGANSSPSAIYTEDDLTHVIKEDAIANYWPIKLSFKQRIKDLIVPNYMRKWHILLRKYEYALTKEGLIAKIRRIIIQRRFERLSMKLGITIPPNVCGAGLRISHYGTVIINGYARIGRNCIIHNMVNIGTSKGDKNCPIIGDNVYIGPGAKIFGKIIIADGCKIGANAVVNSSCMTPNSTLVGIPAKVYAK